MLKGGEALFFDHINTTSPVCKFYYDREFRHIFTTSGPGF